jgi:hypothetical protein
MTCILNSYTSPISFMKIYVASKLLGFNGLVNLSNTLFPMAYSVRDALKLRVLALAGEFMISPYYCFQPDAL